MSNVKRILRSLLENSRSSVPRSYPIQESSIADWEAKGWKYDSVWRNFTKEFGKSCMVVGVDRDTMYMAIYPDKNKDTFYQRFISPKNFNVNYAESMLAKIKDKVDDVDYLDSLGFVEDVL